MERYEKVVKVKNSALEIAKKISMLLGYCLFLSVWLWLALLNLGDIALALLLALAGALLTLLFVLLTWKYFFVEYEYCFEYGELEVAKIYGRRKRKPIVRIDLHSLKMTALATDENISRAEGGGIDKRIAAVSDPNGEDVWLLLSEDEEEGTTLLFLDADERMLSILRSANPIAYRK